MISVKLHSDANAVETDVPVSAIPGILQRTGDLIWVDVANPTGDDLRQIGEIFSFHPLAMNDTRRQHKRPKIDLYGDVLFMVFYGLVDEAGHPVKREVDLFVSTRFLVTIHDGTLPALPEAAEHWCNTIAPSSEPNAGILLYTILDTIVEDYFSIIDDLDDRVESIEAIVLDQTNHRDQSSLLRLKKDLGTIRRLIAPERDVVHQLVQREPPMFPESTFPYFQALFDHIQRVSDAVEIQQNELDNALDVYLSMSSYHLNEVVKRLTAWSIILMTVTLIAGIYGMNFVFMPELDWFLGYPFALGLMLLTTGGLAVLFRKIDWW